jgi:putrescine transport system substrate-binding protein
VPGVPTERLPASLLAALALVACSGSNKPPAAEQTLNIYTWADYIAPDTVANFERETGIKVRYTTFDTNEVLATQLLTGHTNYDIVVPSDFYFDRLMKAGAFRKLDKAAQVRRRRMLARACRRAAPCSERRRTRAPDRRG